MAAACCARAVHESCAGWACHAPCLPLFLPRRTYRGQWYGGTVAVKIIDVWEEEGEGQYGTAAGGTCGSGGIGSGLSFGASGSGSVGSAGTHGGAAPVLEALLSRALSHPHIVSGVAGRKAATALLSFRSSLAPGPAGLVR